VPLSRLPIKEVFHMLEKLRSMETFWKTPSWDEGSLMFIYKL